ncbi:MAG: hypothetical protein IJR47_02695 [Clostridia bacterium]|nr:hypothetical protein [Clostridia bacterium]
MKRIFSITLCIALLLSVGGCKKQGATGLERKLTQKIVDAKSITGNLKGTVKTEISGMGTEEIEMDGNFSVDTKSGFPVFNLKGTMGVGSFLNLPLELSINEEEYTASLLGQSKTSPLKKDTAEQTKEAMKLISKHHASINRTVTESSYEGKPALEIIYDANMLNMVLSRTSLKDVKIENLMLYYVLTEENEPDMILINLKLSNGKISEINAALDITSIE